MLGMVGLHYLSFAVWLVSLGRENRRRGCRPVYDRLVNFDPESRLKGSRAE